MASSEPAVNGQLIIPMTGISARFTAAGYDVPKALIEVEGQTILDHVFDMYPGWDDVLVLCNSEHLADPRLQLQDRILARRPAATIVSVEPHKLGPGWAVLAAEQHVRRDRPVVVNYCDFTCYWDAGDFLTHLSSGDVDASMTVYRGFHPHTIHTTEYAYPLMDGLTVLDVREKQPWTDEPSKEFASSGTYGFASGTVLLDALHRQVQADYRLKGEYYLSLTCKAVLDAGLTVGVYEVQHFMQWGTPEDLAEYQQWSQALAAWTQPPPAPLAGSVRVVLAGGAGQRFCDRGYALPKPLLPVAGTTQLEQSLIAVPADRSVVVTRRDLDDSGAIRAFAAQHDARLVELEGLTRGQADSARLALEQLGGQDRTSVVTITSCDAVPRTSARALEDALVAAGPDGLVVWVARPHRIARQSPKQYGWVEHDQAGLVTDVWLKAAPADLNRASVVVGSFTFPSAERALVDLDELFAQELTVNGEYYLDSLVEMLLDQQRPVVALELDTFVSLGTPNEYESMRYWLSCFHKWSHHPYHLASDPRVPATRRAELDQSFRSFTPEVTGR